MTLPSTGNQISFNQIRIELGVGSQSPFNLSSAMSGLYGAIQKCSVPYPAPDDPDGINEWWSYNHNATASLVIPDSGYPNDYTFDYSGTSCATACGLPVAGNTTLYTANSVYYTNLICTSYPTAGYYASITRNVCYNIGSSGVLNGTSACTTTTTTTTTTTPPSCTNTFSYVNVNSLNDCYQGSYPNTLYSNCSTLTTGCYVYTTSGCGISTAQYIQTSDGTNYQVNTGNGSITNSNNPGC